MSALQHTESGLPKRKLKLLTRKEQRYLTERLKGSTMQEAARAAGLPAWLARTREIPEVEALVEEASQALAEIRFEQCLIDANEIHEYLTDALRARMSDIRNDDHTFKPRSEWPEIWDRMEEAGDVEVHYEFERSSDGKDEGKRGGWDQAGKVENIKMKFASRVKLLELAMKHKAVDAMVQQKQGDINLNFTVTADQQRIERAKRRLSGRVIDAKSVPPIGSGAQESASSGQLPEIQQDADHKP